MKSTTTLFLLISVFLIGQAHSQCDPLDQSSISIISNDHRIPLSDIEALEAFYGSGGSDFVDGLTSPFNSIALRGVWMGGFDPSGNLHTAASDYYFNGVTDYQPGPLLIDASVEQEELCSFYNRIWSVFEQELVDLKENFNSGQLNVDDIPIDILEWPAKNNPHNGEFAVDYDMAPFVDFNSDGVYDPLDGDFPIALDDNPDFSAFAFNFSVINDNVAHAVTRGTGVIMELHQSSYLTNCPSTEELNKSIFYRLKYLYKGQETLDQFKIGIWQDIKLGCNAYSYLGFSEELNANYVYRGIETGQDCGPGIDVPEGSFAIRSTVLLSDDIKSFMVYYNPGFGYTPAPLTDPTSAMSYYNYLDGRWRDATPLTYGGTGYNPGGNSPPANFAFSDFPNDPDGWSMITEDVGFNDIRSLITAFDGVVNPGDVGVIDFVDHMKYSTDYDDVSMFEIYPDVISTLREEYDMAINNRLSCNLLSSQNNLHNYSNIQVYPNPVNDLLRIESIESNVTLVSVMDMHGRRLITQELNETSHSINVEELMPGLYLLNYSVAGQEYTTKFTKM
jgi:hypothetical protein